MPITGIVYTPYLYVQVQKEQASACSFCMKTDLFHAVSLSVFFPFFLSCFNKKVLKTPKISMEILSYPLPSFNAIIAKYSDFNVTPSTEASTEVPLSSGAGSSAEDSSSVNESASDETTAAAE